MGEGNSIVAEKMRAELRVGNEAESLAKDRLNRPGRQIPRERDRQDFRRLAVPLTPQLGVTAPNRDNGESKGSEDGQDLARGKAPKPRHRPPNLPH